MTLKQCARCQNLPLVFDFDFDFLFVFSCSGGSACQSTLCPAEDSDPKVAVFFHFSFGKSSIEVQSSHSSSSSSFISLKLPRNQFVFCRDFRFFVQRFFFFAAIFSHCFLELLHRAKYRQRRGIFLIFIDLCTDAESKHKASKKKRRQ
jgi:hypothetical protein